MMPLVLILVILFKTLLFLVLRFQLLSVLRSEGSLEDSQCLGLEFLSIHLIYVFWLESQKWFLTRKLPLRYCVQNKLELLSPDCFLSFCWHPCTDVSWFSSFFSHVLQLFFFFNFVSFWDRISMCNLAYPGVHGTPAPASQVLRSEAWPTTWNWVCIIRCKA